MAAVTESSRARRALAFGMALASVCSAAVTAPAPTPGASSLVAMAPGCTGSEEVAVDRLMARIKRERLYMSWTTPDCLSYIVDSCTAKAVEVSIHEKHDARCGGDRGTWPRVDSFRVYRHGTRIDWHNVVDDRYRPFDKIHSEGHR